jgi:nitrilase
VKLKLGLPQMAPHWLNREAGIEKVVETIELAAKEGAQLLVFSEAYIPGYPFWLSTTGGSEFDSSKQKEIFAHYSDQSVAIEQGHLDPVCEALGRHHIAAYLGIIERPLDRGGQSLYCSFVFIDEKGNLKSVHRKMQPTYEERLAWSPGDGAGLVTHRIGDFVVGGLNCWENWMPLSRAALYAQGETLHVACWPGSLRNTEDITPFLAKEGRSYSVSVSAIMRPDDVQDDTPFGDEIKQSLSRIHANGGSCVAAPDGSWVLEPLIDEEGIRFCELDPAFVRRERQNFDPSGHYSRPDVTRLVVNRQRQGICEFE